jgi:CRP-like cAMP-binding protein
MALMDVLSRNPIFSHLDEVQRNNLVEIAITRRFQKGQWITHNGDLWPYLFAVESGIVTAVKESSEGRSLIVVSLGPGEVFWGVSFFQEDAVMPVSLVAGEESVVYLWPKDRLLPFMLQDGHISWELAKLMVKRMLRASDIVDELAFQPVTGRLARLLLDHFGEAVEEVVSRDITLEEMAARIGTTREMVCRQLYRFVDEGAIQISRTELLITDIKLLEEMAGKVKG